MSSDKPCNYQLPEHLHDDHLEGQELGCHEPRIFGWPYKGGPYCLFHVQDPASSEKEIGAFTEALKRKRDANYRGFVFPKKISARHLRLENADFTGAHFSGDIDFSDLEFEGPTYFDGVKFNKSAIFKQSAFRGNVSFVGAIFQGETSFRGASFLEGCLERATFRELEKALVGAVDFGVAQFKSRADFTDSKFKVTLSFDNTTFSEDAVFIGAKFCERANARFLRVTFCKDFEFVEADSRSSIDFSWCEFRGEAVFRNAMLQGPMNFYGIAFRRTAIFSQDPPNCFEENRLRVRFAETDMEYVAFRAADLREVSFWHCSNLDKAEFSSCRWNSAYGRQRVLYDEMALRGCIPKWGSWRNTANDPDASALTQEEWERAENTYRDLRRNFEDRRDYAGASEFYVGEMEMRRLPKPRGKREILSLEALYFHLSNYGENWWKPLVFLSLLLGITTLVYAGWPPSLNVLGLSLLHSLSVLTLLRVSILELSHWTWAAYGHTTTGA